MLLGDPIFLVALVPVVVFFYLIPRGLCRMGYALAVSYGYYLTFSLAFLPVLLGITAIAFGGARLVQKFRNTAAGTWIAWTTIAMCFAPLIAFKYLVPALSETVSHGADWQLTMKSVVAPVGLSFYTFAAVGYVIDVALGVEEADRNALKVGLFCGFFPIVTAGPIPRTAILDQFSLNRSFDAERSMQGISQILIGVFMKLWIADRLATPSSTIYANIHTITPLEQFVGTILFAFQLYTDFAGYSLIAIGTAALFGVDLPANFRQPYLSPTINDFWRNWHISLFTWLRDYVFTPLSMEWRARPRLATSGAIFVTLVLVGIWHGAGWGFMAFGVVHGALMVGSQLTLTHRDALWRRLGLPSTLVQVMRVPVTFLIVALTLVLIRAKGLSEAIDIYRNLFSVEMLRNISRALGTSGDGPVFRYVHLDTNSIDIVLIGIVILGDIAARLIKGPFVRLPALARAPVYGVCMLTILYRAISANASHPFVYFQF
jgi:alginate O-acetyltransferase complex protein AlgI